MQGVPQPPKPDEQPPEVEQEPRPRVISPEDAATLAAALAEAVSPAGFPETSVAQAEPRSRADGPGAVEIHPSLPKVDPKSSRSFQVLRPGLSSSRLSRLGMKESRRLRA